MPGLQPLQNAAWNYRRPTRNAGCYWAWRALNTKTSSKQHPHFGTYSNWTRRTFGVAKTWRSAGKSWGGPRRPFANSSVPWQSNHVLASPGWAWDRFMRRPDAKPRHRIAFAWPWRTGFTALMN